ncbi:hypothetical protein [Microbacterium oleivorans]|uniref:Uncharacterized protein n=1 Tax=Microbacterium oleivorans TaxID=273677 RepID=A0A7D5F7U4_9MICO|nr:hypothetical protein [Microbacterium oleivorans]QLD12353.1 hypothetical protein HW566_11565 [Microbacterium oleivorans]
MSMDAADPAAGESVADRWRDDLVSTLDVIEDQPLSERSASYAALHDELSRRLDSGPSDNA